jgi:hypothetical protein
MAQVIFILAWRNCLGFAPCIVVAKYTIDAAPDDKPLQTPVTAERFTSLCITIERNMLALDDHNQQCLNKLANAAERAITARDLLFKENSDLLKQNNESHTRESSNSKMVGKAKIMGYPRSTEETR